MENKKAQWGIFAIILIILIIIAGVIVLFLYLKKTGYFEKIEEVNETSYVTLLLACQDLYGNYLDANYVLEYNNQIFSEGKLDKNYFYPIISKTNELYSFYCWDKEHYVSQKAIAVGEGDSCIIGNETIEKCRRVTHRIAKIGNLSISHTGTLNNEISNLILEISSDEEYTGLSSCISWSSAFVYITPKSNLITCETWLNWSYYNWTSKEYEYYPENITRCAETNKTYLCEQITDNKCIKYPNINPSSKLQNKVDRCYDFKETLINSTMNIEFEVKTLGSLTELDYLTFYFLDKTRTRSPEGWIYSYEDSLGKDIGSPIIEYTIYKDHSETKIFDR